VREVFWEPEVYSSLICYLHHYAEVSQKRIDSRLDLGFCSLAQVRRVKVENVIAFDVRSGSAACLDIPDWLKRTSRDKP
jgi:hypothetical protein